MWQTVLAGLIAEFGPALGKAAAALFQALIEKLLARISAKLSPPTGDARQDRLTLLDAAAAATRPRQLLKRTALHRLRHAVAQGGTPQKADVADAARLIQRAEADPAEK